MPQLTLANCKAPSWEEFPKLAKVRADVVLDEAAGIIKQIKQLQAELAKLQPRIQAKLDTALDEDVKSVLYGELLVTRRAAYERRSLDKKWAVKKLLALKVKKEEIDEHVSVTKIEAGVSLRLLGESNEGEEE